MSIAWQRVVGSISGCTAIGTSAYGAHGLKPSKETYGKTFESGSRFHLLHSILLLSTPTICGHKKNIRLANVSGAFLTLGITLFSGSCYAVAITEDRQNGKLAPMGGVALMAGWLSLALVRR